MKFSRVSVFACDACFLRLSAFHNLIQMPRFRRLNHALSNWHSKEEYLKMSLKVFCCKFFWEFVSVWQCVWCVWRVCYVWRVYYVWRVCSVWRVWCVWRVCCLPIFFLTFDGESSPWSEWRSQRRWSLVLILLGKSLQKTRYDFNLTWVQYVQTISWTWQSVISAPWADQTT